MNNDNKEYFKMIDETVSELKRYAKLEGSELGEACFILFDAYRYAYCYNEEFIKSLYKEIKTQLQYFKENSTIIKKERTILEHTEEYEELEWLE